MLWFGSQMAVLQKWRVRNHRRLCCSFCKISFAPVLIVVKALDSSTVGWQRQCHSLGFYRSSDVFCRRNVSNAEALRSQALLSTRREAFRSSIDSFFCASRCCGHLQQRFLIFVFQVRGDEQMWSDGQEIGTLWLELDIFSIWNSEWCFVRFCFHAVFSVLGSLWIAAMAASIESKVSRKFCATWLELLMWHRDFVLPWVATFMFQTGNFRSICCLDLRQAICQKVFMQQFVWYLSWIGCQGELCNICSWVFGSQGIQLFICRRSTASTAYTAARMNNVYLLEVRAKLFDEDRTWMRPLIELQVSVDGGGQDFESLIAKVRAELRIWLSAQRERGTEIVQRSRVGLDVAVDQGNEYTNCLFYIWKVRFPPGHVQLWYLETNQSTISSFSKMKTSSYWDEKDAHVFGYFDGICVIKQDFWFFGSRPHLRSQVWMPVSIGIFAFVPVRHQVGCNSCCFCHPMVFWNIRDPPVHHQVWSGSSFCFICDCQVAANFLANLIWLRP